MAILGDLADDEYRPASSGDNDMGDLACSHAADLTDDELPDDL